MYLKVATASIAFFSQICDLFNVNRCQIMNWLVSVYKDKEDVLVCGSYMGMELLYNML